ncbi:unnamed protein product [Phytophthora fragariaefolia]|uniref:Unnamed protein product n=1 Tax=Phytophthora fragariaefolia TaxID=1490495 RepID=A0A9W6Y3I0_9STRA|nr:unnamed protein product [Phytophthora fragariaefolia]
MGMKRLIPKLLPIAEATSVCVQPSFTSVQPPPPHEAKNFANTLVSSNRVAVFSTDEQSVVRVLYLGGHTRDDEDIQNVHNIGDSQNSSKDPTTQPIRFSDGCLTDGDR